MKNLIITPKPIMILGTSSGAGKSLMTAAICRVLLRRGENILPFKGQNMSNNAWVDDNGGEMAFSQAMQAWAAGLNPNCAMNPILLKPQGDSTSEVIHLGKSVGFARAEKYYQDWFDSGWDSILRALNYLRDSYNSPRFVIEGAGSPVEVNLQKRDLTNLKIANFLKANCLLVADIERGGVFAQLIGTLALLKPEERSLIRGILINRFRGRRELFEDGKEWIESHTGIPVIGIMPWLNDVFPPEDSLDLLEGNYKNDNAEISIVVIKLQSISNFSDLDPLRAEESVKLKWVEPGQEIGNPDALIIPGSKQTIDDLNKIVESGMASQIIEYSKKGGCIIGICGGMQILGRRLEDPSGIEQGQKAQKKLIISGLDILPLHTTFMNTKKLERRTVNINWPKNDILNGFELHHGVTRLLENSNNIISLSEDIAIGWVLRNENLSNHIVGTYLHGIFDNGHWRRLWLNILREKKGLHKLSLDEDHHSIKIDKKLNLLADSFERHVDINPLIR